MTAAKKPVDEKDKKVWGWFSDDGHQVGDVTYEKAISDARNYKSKYPNEKVSIFKVVATVEITPYIKEV